MPFYDYYCTNCGNVTEVSHAMAETPAVECPFCHAKQIEKLISAPNLTHGKTLAIEAMRSGQRKQLEMKQDLRENYGVHDMAVNKAQNMTYEKVYDEIKANSQTVKDTMIEKRKQSDADVRRKQIERHVAFQKIKDQRIKEVKERTAKQAYERRTIDPIKKPTES